MYRLYYPFRNVGIAVVGIAAVGIPYAIPVTSHGKSSVLPTELYDCFWLSPTPEVRIGNRLL